MSYADLLADLKKVEGDQNELAKSLPTAADADKKVGGAAEGANEGSTGGENEGGATNANTAGGEGGEEANLNKSLVPGANPEDHLIEVDELIKSIAVLQDRLEEGEGQANEIMGGMLGMIKSQNTLIASQGELIKGLREDVKRLGGQGTGRKAILNAVERAQPGEHLNKSLPQEQGMSRQEVLAKCLAAQGAGKITGADVARIESQLNHGVQPDAGIMARIQ